MDEIPEVSLTPIVGAISEIMKSEASNIIDTEKEKLIETKVPTEQEIIEDYKVPIKDSQYLIFTQVKIPEGMDSGFNDGVAFNSPFGMTFYKNMSLWYAGTRAEFWRMHWRFFYNVIDEKYFKEAEGCKASKDPSGWPEGVYMWIICNTDYVKKYVPHYSDVRNTWLPPFVNIGYWMNFCDDYKKPEVWMEVEKYFSDFSPQAVFKEVRNQESVDYTYYQEKKREMDELLAKKD